MAQNLGVRALYIRTTGAREWAVSGRFPSLSGHFL
jgi:hypothetical protein